jgi:para-nitrobenzyl esterase
MTIAQTRSGKVEGLEQDGIEIFLGIPYAAPPVGALRWKAPQPEAAWDDVRDAKEFSAQSAQTAFAMNAMFGGARPKYSEDSLYLNVWTPACDDKRRPVMVWIHGGAFIWGAGDTPWYHGTQFAKNADVVVVTINYRLGPFGFLHLGDAFPELAGSGNLGILDQVAALEWVRDSISAFGGDPDRVTIFGESAGGGSVGTLLGTPSARGLFHRAIAQSGAASWHSTPEAANEVTAVLLERAGVKPGDLDALMALTTDEVLNAQPTFQENGVTSLPFQPVIDGIGLPQPPLDAIRAGNAEGVHVIVGTNAQEMTLFILMDPDFGALDDDTIRARVEATSFIEAGSAIVDDYRRRRPDASAQELWLALSTDTAFRIPAVLLAMAQQGHGPVWSYLFTYETPVFGGVLRSTHALEIPFVFDTLNRAALFTGTGPHLQDLSDAMHGSWAAFARTGDPNHGGLPEWPEYEPTRRATMRFDTTCEVLDDPGRDDREAFPQTLR